MLNAHDMEAAERHLNAADEAHAKSKAALQEAEKWRKEAREHLDSFYEVTGWER